MNNFLMSMQGGTAKKGISYDTSVINGSNTTGQVTWSHTCSGSNRCLIVYVTGSTTAMTATYAGVAMTVLASTTTNGIRCALFSLINPASGANNVVVQNWYYGSGISVSYTGVDSIDAVGSIYESSTYTGYAWPTVTVVASGCWIVVAGASWYPTMTGIGYNMTPRKTGKWYIDYYSLILGDTNGYPISAGVNAEYVAGNTAGRYTTGIAISLKPTP